MAPQNKSIPGNYAKHKDLFSTPLRGLGVPPSTVSPRLRHQPPQLSSPLSHGQILAQQISPLLCARLRRSPLWTLLSQPDATDTDEEETVSGGSQCDQLDSGDELLSEKDCVDCDLDATNAAGSKSMHPLDTQVDSNVSGGFEWSPLEIDSATSRNSPCEEEMDADEFFQPTAVSAYSWSPLSIDLPEMNSDSPSSFVEQDRDSDVEVLECNSGSSTSPLAKSWSLLSINDQQSTSYTPDASGSRDYYASDQDDDDFEEDCSSPCFRKSLPFSRTEVTPDIRTNSNISKMDVDRLKQQDRQEAQGGHLAGESIGKSTRQKHRDGAILRLQSDVWQIVAFLMGRLSPDHPVEAHHVVDSTGINQFIDSSQRIGGPVMAESRLKVDVSTNQIATPWNKQAAVLFSDYFRSLEGYSIYPNKLVQKTYTTHLSNLRNKYMRGQAPKTIENKQKSSDRNQRLSCDQQVRNLFYRRLGACDAFKADPSIKKVHRLMERMPIDAMSGDETDHRQGNLNYVVRTPAWRNPEVEEFFKVLDSLHLST